MSNDLFDKDRFEGGHSEQPVDRVDERHTSGPFGSFFSFHIWCSSTLALSHPLSNLVAPPLPSRGEWQPLSNHDPDRSRHVATSVHQRLVLGHHRHSKSTGKKKTDPGPAVAHQPSVPGSLVKFSRSASASFWPREYYKVVERRLSGKWAQLRRETSQADLWKVHGLYVFSSIDRVSDDRSLGNDWCNTKPAESLCENVHAGFCQQEYHFCRT